MRRPLSEISHQALLPVFFRTQFQDLLFPQEVHWESACYAIGKLFYGRAFEIFRVILEKQRMAGFVEFDELALQHGIPGSSTVLQVFHWPSPKRIFSEQSYYAKRNAAHGHNVHASAVIPLDDFPDLCGAAEFPPAF